MLGNLTHPNLLRHILLRDIIKPKPRPVLIIRQNLEEQLFPVLIGTDESPVSGFEIPVHFKCAEFPCGIGRDNDTPAARRIALIGNIHIDLYALSCRKIIYLQNLLAQKSVSKSYGKRRIFERFGITSKNGATGHDHYDCLNDIHYYLPLNLSLDMTSAEY